MFFEAFGLERRRFVEVCIAELVEQKQIFLAKLGVPSGGINRAHQVVHTTRRSSLRRVAFGVFESLRTWKALAISPEGNRAAAALRPSFLSGSAVSKIATR